MVCNLFATLDGISVLRVDLPGLLEAHGKRLPPGRQAIWTKSLPGEFCIQQHASRSAAPTILFSISFHHRQVVRVLRDVNR